MRPGPRAPRLQPLLPFDTGPRSEAKLQDSGGGVWHCLASAGQRAELARATAPLSMTTVPWGSRDKGQMAPASEGSVDKPTHGTKGTFFLSLSRRLSLRALSATTDQDHPIFLHNLFSTLFKVNAVDHSVLDLLIRLLTRCHQNSPAVLSQFFFSIVPSGRNSCLLSAVLREMFSFWRACFPPQGVQTPPG